jgi:O-antigen/teichoic acid export membrane protein
VPVATDQRERLGPYEGGVTVASIARRTAILAFARLTNQALALLSPLFLVRLLTVEQYGQYRDFLLYGALLVPWVQLNINSSLAYFVAREPEKERVFLSQAGLFVLISSTIVSVLILIFHGYFPSDTTQLYVVALCLYLMFVNNLDAWEIYWLAKRQSLIVLYYSIARIGLRMAVVVVAAYVSRSVATIIWTLVAFEALRLSAVVLYGLRNRLFTTKISVEAINSSSLYLWPLWPSCRVSMPIWGKSSSLFSSVPPRWRSIA